jgi:FixJ family two-component response regulator
MNSKDILVLGSHAQSDLMQSLSRVGFVPQVWGSMRHTLDKLLHQRFAAVIVDRKFTHADVLEFILNVRDINQEIPVIVIGSGNDERIDRKISKLGRTIILNGSERNDILADKLVQAFTCSEKENV